MSDTESISSNEDVDTTKVIENLKVAREKASEEVESDNESDKGSDSESDKESDKGSDNEDFEKDKIIADVDQQVQDLNNAAKIDIPKEEEEMDDIKKEIADA